MFGLTPLGIVHTLSSLIAIVCGIRVLISDGVITPHSTLGRVYLIGTLVAATTTFGIFQHGGFGPGHILAVLTLLALSVGMLATYRTVFGKFTQTLQTLSFSATLLFHAIPGVTEALTRLPLGADSKPLFSTALDPAFKPIHLSLLVLFLLGVTWQLRRQCQKQACAANISQ